MLVSVAPFCRSWACYPRSILSFLLEIPHSLGFAEAQVLYCSFEITAPLLTGLLAIFRFLFEQVCFSIRTYTLFLIMIFAETGVEDMISSADETQTCCVRFPIVADPSGTLCDLVWDAESTMFS